MGFVASFVFVSLSSPGFADEKDRYRENIERGRAYLLAQLKRETKLGHLGLGVMALLKTAPIEADGPNKGHAKKTPELQKLVDQFAEIVETRESEFRDQEGTYAIAVAVSCLIADDSTKHERVIRKLVARIIANQKPNGSWSYPSGSPEFGDTSQVQYIALALWEAANAGVKVPPRVWDSLLDWQIKTQDAQGVGGPGGFVYQPRGIPDDAKAIDQGNEIATMGVAGLSTLLICQSQLTGLKHAANGKGGIPIDEVIRPAGDDPNANAFVPKVTWERLQAAVSRAETWVGRNSIFRDPFKDLAKANYYLYGYERIAALRKGVKNSPINNGDWYRAGGDFLARSQNPDGSWSMGAHWTPVADTAFALLFLHKTMEIKVGDINPKVELMGRSIAVGGTGGLPAADGATTGGLLGRQQDRHKAQPKTSIDELIRILDDPEGVVPEETIAKVEQLKPAQLKEVLEKASGEPKKLRIWAYDKRPAARSVALTILARSREVRFAPILIAALNDKDVGVYNAARDGLRYLSRNVEVFGLPVADKRSPEKLKEGIDRASEWFKTLNVEVAAYQEFSPPAP